MVFYSHYAPKKLEKGTSFKGHKEVANQQLAEEVEITSLIKQYIEQGPCDMPVVRDLNFGDSTITFADYQQYKDIIKQISDDWFSLPKETQRAFGSIDNYVNSLSQAYAGNVDSIKKIQNSNIVLSPNKGADVGTSGTSSSSLSRSDSKNSDTNLNSNDSTVLQDGGK